MSTHITGMLMQVGECGPDSPLAQAVVLTTRDVLREVERIPMYEEVTVIRTAELDALRHTLEKAVELLDRDSAWDEAMCVVGEARALLKGGKS